MITAGWESLSKTNSSWENASSTRWDLSWTRPCSKICLVSCCFRDKASSACGLSISSPYRLPHSCHLETSAPNAVFWQPAAVWAPCVSLEISNTRTVDDVNSCSSWVFCFNCFFLCKEENKNSNPQTFYSFIFYSVLHAHSFLVWGFLTKAKGKNVDLHLYQCLKCCSSVLKLEELLHNKEIKN